MIILRLSALSGSVDETEVAKTVIKRTDKSEKMIDLQHKSTAPLYMPDGTPAPYVMTAEELIIFLRLDGGKSNPHNTLEYYRKRRMLRATRIGKVNFYTQPEVIIFLERISGGNTQGSSF